MTYLRLLNMELVLSSRKSDGGACPATVLGLPVEEAENHSDCDVVSDASTDDGKGAALNTHPGGDALGEESAEDPDPETSGSYPKVMGMRCPPLPHASELQEWLGLPHNLGRPSAESRYAGEYVTRTRETSIDVSHACVDQKCVSQDVRGEALCGMSWSLHPSIWFDL